MKEIYLTYLFLVSHLLLWLEETDESEGGKYPDVYEAEGHPTLGGGLFTLYITALFVVAYS